jgi:hypothetical protein
MWAAVVKHQVRNARKRNVFEIGKRSASTGCLKPERYRGILQRRHRSALNSCMRQVSDINQRSISTVVP